MKYLLILLAVILSHAGFSQKVIPANAGTVLQNRDVSNNIPSNGDVPKWNNTSQKWEPATDNAGSGVNGYDCNTRPTYTSLSKDFLGENYITVRAVGTSLQLEPSGIKWYCIEYDTSKLNEYWK